MPNYPLFIETAVFSRAIAGLWTDEQYRAFQTFLVVNPEAGDLIIGGGGLRKVRWQAIGRGKRGGTRVIYYWAVEDGRIICLLAYAKNEMDDLTKDQLAWLRQQIE